jgi:hypothetical protein
MWGGKSISKRFSVVAEESFGLLKGPLEDNELVKEEKVGHVPIGTFIG